MTGNNDNYPPGAANDPNAPYNQTREPEECPDCEDGVTEDGCDCETCDGTGEFYAKSKSEIRNARADDEADEDRDEDRE